MDPREKKRFGAWRMNVPPNKQSFPNILNVWFIFHRLFAKLETLITLLDKKNLKLFKVPSKKPTSKKITKSLNTTIKKSREIKTTPVEKEIPVENDNKILTESKKKQDIKKLNWRFFSENYKYPSIFIENWNFVPNVLKNILFDCKLSNFMVDYALKYLTQKPKDKILQKTIKLFLRLFIIFERDQSRDSQILSFISELIISNQKSIKKGKTLLLYKFLKSLEQFIISSRNTIKINS